MALDKNAFLDKEYFQKRSQKHRQKRKMAMSSNNAAHMGKICKPLGKKVQSVRGGNLAGGNPVK